MREDYNGDLYDVYYLNGNGERQCVCYFGHSKRDAERLPPVRLEYIWI